MELGSTVSLHFSTALAPTSQYPPSSCPSPTQSFHLSKSTLIPQCCALSSHLFPNACCLDESVPTTLTYNSSSSNLRAFHQVSAVAATQGDGRLVRIRQSPLGNCLEKEMVGISLFPPKSEIPLCPQSLSLPGIPQQGFVP